MKLIVILFGCINSIDLDEGTNLLQTGILQHYTESHSPVSLITQAQGADFDESKWKYWPGYQIYEQNGQNADECYPTLSEAIAKCEEAGDCGAIATQGNFCGGQYRITHGGPHLAGPTGSNAWVLINCVTPGGPTENGIVGGLKWDPGYVGTYRYYGDNCSDYGQTTTTTTTTCLTGICVSSATCGAIDTSASVALDCNGKTDCSFTVTEENSQENVCVDPAAVAAAAVGTNNKLTGRYIQSDGLLCSQMDPSVCEQCYPALQEAMDKCDATADCSALVNQGDVCSDHYCFVKGGPSLRASTGPLDPTLHPRVWQINKSVGPPPLSCKDAAAAKYQVGANEKKTGRYQQSDGILCSQMDPSVCEQCYPTLKEAMGKCDATADCNALVNQADVCSDHYCVVQGGIHPSLRWDEPKFGKMDPIRHPRVWQIDRAIDPAGCKDAYTISYSCGQTKIQHTASLSAPSRGQTTTLRCAAAATTTNLSDEQQACISRESVKNWANFDCCGFGTRDAATKYCKSGIDDHVIGEVCCKSQCDDGCTTASTTPVTTSTTNPSDEQQACISRESVKNWANFDCCGFGTRDAATKYCKSGIDDHVIGEVCCKSQCDDGCMVDGKENYGVTTTTSTTPVTTSTTNPGGPTNVGGKDCFAAIATWGPDFECNAKVSSFCADDSADGLDVSACCQDYCNSNQEKRTKKKDSEANSKEAEGERKSKRQESRSKRKDAESARKKQKKEAEWLAKRGAQETSNKKAEDERKTKNGYSESKRKNERSWKANRSNAKKAAQRREAARKVGRAESAKKNSNSGSESSKKNKLAEKKQKKKAFWKAKKEKRKKNQGKNGRKGRKFKGN